MKRIVMILLAGALVTVCQFAVMAQDSSNSRDRNRDQLQAVLNRVGPTIKVEFKQNDQHPYVFTGFMKDGLTSVDSFEIVISVGAQDTIHFRIYPNYHGGYINIDKAKNGGALMRQLLRFSDNNFLYWGIDDTNDVFAGYNFTLESGFPEASITVVLQSIKNLDQFVGQMKTNIDASSTSGHGN